MKFAKAWPRGSRKNTKSAPGLWTACLSALATGHLTVTGMRSSDSERAIVGGLGSVSHKVFPERFGSRCLRGHLHRPQSPGGGQVRYSGSPIPLAGEAEDAKEVLDVSRMAKTFPACSDFAI